MKSFNNFNFPNEKKNPIIFVVLNTYTVHINQTYFESFTTLTLSRTRKYND